jgi:hypothetical protein
MVDEKGQEPVDYNPVRFLQEERIQDGRKFLVRTSLSPQGLDNDANYTTASFDGSIGKTYYENSNQSSTVRGFGSIYRGLPDWGYSRLNKFELFLGTAPDPDLLSKSAYRKEPQWKGKLEQQYPLGIPIFLDEYYNALKAEWVIVHPNLESVAGEPCHVLELDPGGYIEKFWLAHDKGMLPMKTMYLRSQDYVKQKIITRKVKEIASIETETGTLWYPRVITEERIQKPNYSYTIEVTIDEFVPNFKASAETFSYEFPNGTLVYDKNKDLRYYVGEESTVNNKR